MWFSLGRSEGYPSQYPAMKTAVTVDVLESGYIYAAVILFICFLIALPNVRLKNNIFLFIRVTVGLLIGLFILLANIGQEWEVANIETRTPYKIGIPNEIHAAIGIKIGLRSVNVTLRSDVSDNIILRNETINYNERFEWTWDQGRLGFGQYSGLLQQQFRAAQYKGLPLPILWIVDYFVIDGEGFRFGRFYRLAGWYTHVLIWTAFPCWLLAIIFFRSVVRFGAYFLALAGVCLCGGNIVYASLRNVQELSIPFEDATLVTKFGTSFYLALGTGITSLILALLILVAESYWDIEVSIFFGVDPLTSYDEYHLTPMELELLRKKDHIPSSMNTMPMVPMSSNQEEDKQQLAPVTQPVYLKRKTTIRIGGAPRFRKPRAVSEDEEAIYGNMEAIREHEMERSGTTY